MSRTGRGVGVDDDPSLPFDTFEITVHEPHYATTIGQRLLQGGVVSVCVGGGVCEACRGPEGNLMRRLDNLPESKTRYRYMLHSLHSLSEATKKN